MTRCEKLLDEQYQTVNEVMEYLPSCDVLERIGNKFYKSNINRIKSFLRHKDMATSQDTEFHDEKRLLFLNVEIVNGKPVKIVF